MRAFSLVWEFLSNNMPPAGPLRGAFFTIYAWVGPGILSLYMPAAGLLWGALPPQPPILFRNLKYNINHRHCLLFVKFTFARGGAYFFTLMPIERVLPWGISMQFRGVLFLSRK